MGQLHHRSAKATPSLASTPEKDTDPSEDPDNGQKASSQGAGQASDGQTLKAGGLGWGVMSRVASGLLGSGSKKGAPDKKVSCALSYHHKDVPYAVSLDHRLRSPQWD